MAVRPRRGVGAVVALLLAAVLAHVSSSAACVSNNNIVETNNYGLTCLQDPINFRCRPGNSITSMFSRHYNAEEDREWIFRCQATGTGVETATVQTGFVNNYDGVVNYQCPTHFMLVGVASEHSNTNEDRRFRFHCAGVPGATLSECAPNNNFINNYDGIINYGLSSSRVLAGFYSEHNNIKEDRLFKPITCQIDCLPGHIPRRERECEPVDCGRFSIDNGDVSGRCNGAFGDQCMLASCDAGYEFSSTGDDAVECGINDQQSQWLGNPKTCIDVDECDVSNECENVEFAECVNTEGGYRCECSQPYTELGRDGDIDVVCGCEDGFMPGPTGCLDVNECEENPTACDGNEVCVNTDGSFLCECADGYQFHTSERRCVDVDECTTSGQCPADELCFNTEGSFECECADGYQRNTADECVDLNECLLLDSPCSTSPHSRCENKEGGYECVCDEGFEEASRTDDFTVSCECESGFQLIDGDRECTDIDECASDGACDASPFSLCENRDGSYRCECDELFVEIARESDHLVSCECMEGYFRTPTGSQCLDIDECADGSHVCGGDSLSQCSNTEGAYRCICPFPFVELARTSDTDVRCGCGSGYVQDEFTGGCLDVNECQLGDPCSSSPNSVCNNTVGSYECVCNETFIEAGREDHRLVICECPHGYFDSSGRCVDVDECEAFSGEACSDLANAHCENTAGSYRCECDETFHEFGREGGMWVNCACAPGFDVQDGACADVDECDLFGSETCSHNNHAHCENTIGRFQCVCDDTFTEFSRQSDDMVTCGCHDGFEVVDGECVDIDECVLYSGEACSHNSNAHCENVPGYFKCVCDDTFTEFSRDTNDTVTCECDDGFALVGDMCEDVDECEVYGRETCSHNANAHCVNTAGGFECVCDETFSELSRTSFDDVMCDCGSGYSLDEVTNRCEDRNECTISAQDPCSRIAHSECINTEGGYFCSCVDGYARAGGSCINVDECFLETDNCGRVASCVDTDGSFECECDSGYQWDAANADCVDVDECLTVAGMPGPCDGYAHVTGCANLVGSYNCTCEPGFMTGVGSTTPCTMSTAPGGSSGSSTTAALMSWLIPAAAGGGALILLIIFLLVIRKRSKNKTRLPSTNADTKPPIFAAMDKSTTGIERNPLFMGSVGTDDGDVWLEPVDMDKRTYEEPTTLSLKRQQQPPKTLPRKDLVLAGMNLADSTETEPLNEYVEVEEDEMDPPMVAPRYSLRKGQRKQIDGEQGEYVDVDDEVGFDGREYAEPTEGFGRFEDRNYAEPRSGLDTLQQESTYDVAAPVVPRRGQQQQQHIGNSSNQRRAPPPVPHVTSEEEVASRSSTIGDNGLPLSEYVDAVREKQIADENNYYVEPNAPVLKRISPRPTPDLPLSEYVDTVRDEPIMENNYVAPNALQAPKPLWLNTSASHTSTSSNNNGDDDDDVPPPRPPRSPALMPRKGHDDADKKKRKKSSKKKKKSKREKKTSDDKNSRQVVVNKNYDNHNVTVTILPDRAPRPAPSLPISEYVETVRNDRVDGEDYVVPASLTSTL